MSGKAVGTDVGAEDLREFAEILDDEVDVTSAASPTPELQSGLKTSAS